MIKTFDVATIRKDFPILETGLAYLDSANTSQRPRQVTGAMMEYFEKFNSNIHRAAYRIAEEATVRYEATREKVRELIRERLIRASTSAPSAATSTRSAGTRCWVRPARASCTAAASCSRRWTRSCPAGT